MIRRGAIADSNFAEPLDAAGPDVPADDRAQRKAVLGVVDRGREQLGERVAKLAGADFARPEQNEAGDEDEATVHGTQKPVECMRRPILNNSARGDAVYEPFCGSGTTLIACEKRKRICYAMDTEPKWVQVTINRWERLTGWKAEKLP